MIKAKALVTFIRHLNGFARCTARFVSKGRVFWSKLVINAMAHIDALMRHPSLGPTTHAHKHSSLYSL